MDEEIWKVYKETYGNRCGYRLYEVSNQGNVKVNGDLVINLTVNNNGYYRISNFTVHRAVAELFIPNPNNYPEVDHIDGNKLNNKTENLRWCTHEMNLNNPITRKRKSISATKVNARKDIKQNKSKALKNNKHALNHVWMCNGIDKIFPHKSKSNYYLSLGYHFGQK